MKAPTAVLLVVSIAMCHELSKDEIEEFTDYLWKTSALDQNLKDGTNVGHDDEEEVSEHAWEESGKFEGDLILNERQRRLIVEDVTEGLSRNGLKDSTKRWPDNEVIFYIQREHFSGDQVQAIKEGIDDLSQASCIKFRPYKKGDRDAVVIQGSRRGCFSQVGYQGGYQVLNLSGRHPVGRGCFRHGTVVHELLHTLGFYHMQSSHDRDDYIDVLWENIVKPARHNFRKYNAFAVSDFGVGYDYDSVLHYSRRAFSANGGDTLVPKQNGAQIGQRVGLSDKDTQKLNKMYCDADSNSFDAEGQRPFKPIKKPRNQPFQGHGIGYHQGKTVVIKLPEAESLKSPEPSSYAVFDYFSKVPQALPPTIVQGLGVGKEIAYIPPVTLFRDEQVRSIKEPEISRKETPFIVKDTEITSLGGVKDVERKPDTETLNDSAVRPKDDTKVNQDLLEAFERLGKIIRSHVYPSSKSDATKLYDFNKDYSAFDNPNSKAYESKAKKIHELLSHSPKKPERIETKEKHSGDAEDINNDGHNNKSNVHSNVFVSPLYNKIYNEFDSSFGTSLPTKNNVGETFKIASKYSKPVDENEFSHVKTYNDYSSLYKSNRKGSNKPYSLLGGPVPLRENWYKENNRPKLDLPKKKYARYADRHKLKTELEPQRDKNILKYKDMISIPYKKKDGSKEDSTSIEYPYKEHSAEKMYDKYGHIGNYKSWSKVRDSSERNPEDKSIELASLKLYGGDRTKHTYDSVSDEDYYSDVEDAAGGPRKDPKANAMKKKSENPIDYKENTFIQDKLYDKYTYKEKQALTPSKNTIQPIAYQVTEEIDEKDHEVPKKDKTTVTPKSDEDYSSFEREMDDRLANILKNYAKIDNFDIESPYGSSYHESLESPEIIREK